jgi:foldase protein PrsA
MRGMRFRRAAALLVLLVLLLTGCGGRIIMTTGFSGDQVLQVGGRYTRMNEVRGYILDLVKQYQKIMGTEALEGADTSELKATIRNKAISQIYRVKALNALAIQDNIMLTDDEDALARRAAEEYLDGMTGAELTYLGLTVTQAETMFREYALADKVYRSIGNSFEDRYNSFVGSLDSDINVNLWNSETIGLVDTEADLNHTFIAVYNRIFH